MKNVVSFVCAVAFCFLIVISGFVLSGCEEAGGQDGLTIDPSSKSLTTEERTAQFTVTGGITNQSLALPLTWSVTDSSLGNITQSSGLSAVYERNDANGNNTIIVKDQYENEGYATVNQTAVAYTLALTASPSSEIPFGSDTVTISVNDNENAQAPFTWSVQSGAGSIIGGQGTDTAVFQSTDLNVAVIKCTDANGAEGVISITHASPSP